METILITGSTRGIGLCIASYLATRKYTVIIHGSQDESLLPVKHTFRHKSNIYYVSHDLLQEPTTLIDTCLQLEGVSKIDILVNNCGIASGKESVMDIHHVNMIVPYKLTHYAATKGINKVINFSSGGAAIYHTEMSDYCLSKKCVEDMTKHMAFHYDGTLIVTCLRIDECFQTDMAQAIYPEEYSSFESPQNLIPLFMGILKMGSECSGKIYSYRRSRIDLVSELRLCSQSISNQSFTFPDNRKDRFVCNGENKFSGDAGKYPRDSEIHLLEKELSRRYNIPTSNLVINHGGISGAFDTLCSQFIKEGDEVIGHSLCFQPMLQSITQRGGRLILIQPGFETGFDLKYHLSDIIQKITPATRLIFLVHPTYMFTDTFDSREFMEMIQQVPHNIPIILDECYIDYIEERECIHSGTLIDSHLVFGLRTFSKMYGLASCRLGYVICPSKFKGFIQNSSSFKVVPTETVRIAYKTLHEGLYIKSHEEFIKERTYLHQRLRQNRIQFKGHSMFVVIRVDPTKKQMYLDRLSENCISLPDFQLSDELIIYTIMQRPQNKIIIDIISTNEWSQ